MVRYPVQNVVTGATTISLLLALASAGPALAQQSGAARGGLEEIVVTARKREETLQTVPVAVTAFTAEAIRRQRLETINDLALFTPGLVYQDISVGFSIPTIRGLAQTNIASDNNVAMFLNGIYLSNARTLDVGMVALERIEVIKGPQSALYGQNSFAGAINYISRQPGDRFEADVEATIGTNELFELAGTIGGPITDTLAGILTASWKSFDGTFSNDNPATGDNLQGYDFYGLSGALVFSPTEQLTAKLFGFYQEMENDLAAQYLVANNCGTSQFATPTFYCGKLPVDGRFDLTTNGTFGRDARTAMVSLNVDYELSENWAIRSLTAWVDTTNERMQDFDFTSAGVPFAVRNRDTLAAEGTVLTNTFLGQGFPGDNRDLSQELRLEFTEERLDVMLGGFWYDSDRKDGSLAAVDSSVLGPDQEFTSAIARIFATDDPVGALVRSNLNEEEIRTIAVFGRLGFRATEQLRLSAELRWAQDKKEINRILNFANPVVNNAQQSETFNYVTPRLTADYQLTEDALLYAVYAEGARAGGFNANASQNPDFAAESSYDEEKNKTYEIGAKTQWLDRRLTLNLALFRIDWDDMQLNSRSLDPNNIFAVVRNTGKVRSEGFEVEGILAVTDNMQVGANYAYTDPKYRSGSVDVSLAGFCGVDTSICPNGTDISGQQLGRTVKNQFSAFVALNQQLNRDWNGFMRADVATQSKQPTNAINAAFTDGFTVVNARLGIENDRYEVALWAKNLFDESYLTASSNQPRFHVGSVNDVTFGQGRVVGLSALARFGQ